MDQSTVDYLVKQDTKDSWRILRQSDPEAYNRELQKSFDRERGIVPKEPEKPQPQPAVIPHSHPEYVDFPELQKHVKAYGHAMVDVFGDELKAIRDALTKRVETIETTLSGVADAGRVAELQNEVRTLQAQRKADRAELDKMRQTISSLTKHTQSLERKISELRRD